MDTYPELQKSLAFFNKNTSEGIFLLQNYFKEQLEVVAIDKALLQNELKLAQSDMSFNWRFWQGNITSSFNKQG